MDSRRWEMKGKNSKTSPMGHERLECYKGAQKLQKYPSVG